MAKSKSFFGLRRGSTKSHTYQVYRGLQITKDRVYDVSNPQSAAQMEQRLKLPMVANAASILSGIVNHSFEGVEYGDASIRTFRQLNLRKDNLSVTSYVPKGMMNTGNADFIISRGTLDNVGLGGLTTEARDPKILYFENAVNLDTASIPAATAGSALTAEQLAFIKPMFLGTNDYDQVTFILSYAGNGYNWTGSDGETKTEPYNRFVVSRLVFNTERFSEDAEWKWVENADDGTSLDLDNGYVHIKLYYNKQLSAGDAIEISLSTVNTALADKTLLMGCCVVSTLDGDTWRRNNEKMTTVQAPEISYSDVINTYLNSTDGAASDRYLNNGSSSVNITGGDTTE